MDSAFTGMVLWRWVRSQRPLHFFPVATTLENHADLLRKMGRDEEAEKIEARAKAIRAKHAQENPPN